MQKCAGTYNLSDNLQLFLILLLKKFLLCISISVLVQHYDPSHQTLSYDSYGSVLHGPGDTDRPPSGTPSTSVHSSPSRPQGNTFHSVVLLVLMNGSEESYVVIV